MPAGGSQLVFFFGPAGSGKSTLAEAWCRTRKRAIHIELDEVRSLIVSGLADPQSGSALVGEQYETSVNACCALAKVFLADGYDVAVDDAASPGDFARYWERCLGSVNWRIVVIRPDLETTLGRNERRQKSVRPDIIRQQHSDAGKWPSEVTIDTSGMTVEESLQQVLHVLDPGQTG